MYAHIQMMIAAAIKLCTMKETNASRLQVAAIRVVSSTYVTLMVLIA